MQSDLFEKYISEINKAYLRGDATEHTHRPALKSLIENLADKITATNEPKRRTDCGAPDMLVSLRKRNHYFRVGYIECKDIGTNLKKEEKSEQIKKRYLPSLHNFILTDYVQFRWYTNGELRLTATLARESEGGEFKATCKGKSEVEGILRNFLEHEAEKVSSAKELAERMGHLARFLRDVTKRTFKQEGKSGPLHTHLAAFRKVLLHGLSEEQFADIYAQSIAYGLFAARCHIEGITIFGKDKYGAFHGINGGATDLTREHAAYLLPKTNPFLRKIFGQIVGPELDERLVWLVDDLVELLREAKIEVVLKGFGKKGGRSDPVVHFYETFLKEYDPELRELRGVYYTPDEVVSYIVRSVDRILKDKFKIKRGLADETKLEVGGQSEHKVLILDPAVGTGTFLFQVVEQIRNKFKRQKGAWSGYVQDHLLQRLFGFEFMMAPYAIAHTMLGLQLSELDYDFQSDERLGIYLTNTLEEAQKITENVFIRGLSDEATEANRVKKDLPIMVVLGNPPYSGHSANKSWEVVKGKKVLNFIGRLLKDYYKLDGKPLGEKNPKWLQDDYVKFIRFGQWRIEQTGAGILAFITNHSYLDNPTFRGMRQQLMSAFSEIYILDLHGNLRSKEPCPDGSPDMNVFDIQQGVAIGIFVKMLGQDGPAKVYHADCWGSRKSKYKRLSRETVDDTDWVEIEPSNPFYLFKPQELDLLAEYEQGLLPMDVMPVNVLGFQTHRDNFAVDFEKQKLQGRMIEMREFNLSDDEFASKYLLKDNRDWKLQEARNRLRDDKQWKDNIIECLYRPFDKRVCYFSEVAMDYPRRQLLDHVARRDNICLGVGRQGIAVNDPEWSLVAVSREPIDANIFRRGGINVFPLYLYHYEDEFKGKHRELFERARWEPTKEGRIPNLTPEFVEEVAKKVGLKFKCDGKGDFKETFGPEDILDYMYALFHSHEFRIRYAGFLKIDFPRVLLPSGGTIFRKLCTVGEELVKLHLMEASVLDNERRWAAFNVTGNNAVEKGYPSYIGHGDVPDMGKVHINKDQYFEGIQPNIWDFRIGGYQVFEKWLKYRRERNLSYDDVRHYQKIVVALRETIRLMKQIDEIINTHGGWPIK